MVFDCVMEVHLMHIWAASREKVPNILSRCQNQKKDGRAWPHTSFFWYDTDF